MTGLFDHTRPYVFHIELTDRCNAGCPMCPRTDEADHCRPDRSVLADAELTIDDFRTHFTDDLCARTDQVVLSGNFGDPLAARDCLDICDYLTARHVRIAISTNGSLRNAAWWTRLGALFQGTDSRIELHVDGLAETNPLYRVHTDFEKIMENARAYLSTGATAEWHYILFRHNEQDVEAAAALSREMGFAQFVVIDSMRFPKDGFEYQMPDGTRRVLAPPRRLAADIPSPGQAAGTVDAVERDRRRRLGAPESGPGISCKSREMNRPYISARGQVHACCWVVNSADEARLYGDAGLAFGDNNIHHRPLEEILAGEPFGSLYADGWRRDSLPVCQRKCGEMRRNRRHFA